MGVTSIIKNLICDDDNNITINTAIQGIISTVIISTLVYAFFYLPYMIIVNGNETASLGGVIMGVIGVISWLFAIIYTCEWFNKHGNRVLYTWK